MAAEKSRSSENERATRAASWGVLALLAAALLLGCHSEGTAEDEGNLGTVHQAIKTQPGKPGGQCGFVQQLSSGDVLFAITFPVAQAQVEVFSRKNGVQNIAHSMLGLRNADGSYTYQYTAAGSTYHAGDRILTRFFSHAPSSPGVLSPGPNASTWLPAYIYGSATCSESLACLAPATDPPYVTQLADGNVQFTVTLAGKQQHVEVFVQQNGVQNIAQSIESSGVAGPNGTFSYSLQMPASKYKANDVILARFYSHKPGSPGVFTPGPFDNVWAAPLVYGYCSGHGSCTAGSPGQCTCSPGYAGQHCETHFICTGQTLDDGNPCTADTCDETHGVQHTPVAGGTACSDGNVCNGAETCNAAGACVAGAPPSLDDGNPCTADACDPVSGVSHTAVADGSACDDGNACTQNDACQSGSCTGSNPVICTAADPCHQVGSCDPSTGICSNPEIAGGLGCGSALVGSQGGSVQIDGVGRVDIPAGALSAPTNVFMHQVPPPSIEGGDITLTTPIVELGPEGLKFQQPVTLTLSYDPSRLPASAPTAKQKIYQILNGSLVPDGTDEQESVDVTTTSLSVPLMHFSMHVGGTSGPVVPIAITAGEQHTCALLSDGTAICWGANSYGQLGDGTLTSYSTTAVPVVGLTHATAIAAGGYTTCALLADQTVQCWGDNTLGEVGNGTSLGLPSFVATPAAVLNLGGVTAIAGGARQMCALLASGNVSCWGYNGEGALGMGSQAPPFSPVPVDVAGLSGVTSIAGGAGADYMCAVQGLSHFVYCWGDNTYHQLGNSLVNTVRSFMPVKNEFVYGVTSLALGAAHVCDLGGGEVECWGAGSSGDLGDGTTASSLGPVLVQGLTNVTQVSAGSSFGCAVLAGGTADCWGYDGYGELGNGPGVGPELCAGGVVASPCSTKPAPVTGLTNAISIATGAQHACALLSTGVIKCWGDDGYAQLGNGEQGIEFGSTTPIALAACTVGAIRCAGNGTETCGPNGQWATGEWCPTGCIAGKCAALPQVSVGTSFACKLQSAGTVECWGYSGGGALGDGTDTGPQTCASGSSLPPYACATTPVPVPGLTDVIAISLDGPNACALLSGGTVECWGDNRFGQLGNGTNSGPEQCGNPNNVEPCSTTPVPVSGLTGVKAISVGIQEACALLLDGTIKCWGNNSLGQLGNGTQIDSTIPVAVSGIAGATAVSVGSGEACALLSGGAVECWGENMFGQLGTGTNVGPQNCVNSAGTAIPCSTLPVLVSGLSGATAISAGVSNACALLPNGIVKCWGYNGDAALGDGTNTGPQGCTLPFAAGYTFPCSTLPVPVSGLSGATAISFNVLGGCALLAGGTVKCWGENPNGELGDGTSTGPETCVYDTATFPCSTVAVPVSGMNGATAVAVGIGTTCATLSDGTIECWGDNSLGQLGIGTSSGPETCGSPPGACSTTPVPVSP